MLSLSLLHLLQRYHSCHDVSCYRREAVCVCCIFLFFQKWQRFIISFRHCLNSSWTVTAFSWRGLSLYSGGELQLIWKKGLPVGSQITRLPSWLHLKFWVSAQELGDQGLLVSLFILELFLPRSLLLNGRRTLRRAQFCYAGTFKFLASLIQQSTWKWRLPVQLGRNSQTSFISLAEISWRVFGTAFSKAHTFEYLVLNPTNFILDQ